MTGFTASADFPIMPDAVDSSQTAATTPSWRGSTGRAPLWRTRPSWEGRALTPARASPPTKRQGDLGDSHHRLRGLPDHADAHDQTYNGNGDAFVATFDRFSTLAYSTFLGGTASDAGSGIAVDEKGKLAYVTGTTASADSRPRETRTTGATTAPGTRSWRRSSGRTGRSTLDVPRRGRHDAGIAVAVGRTGSGRT